MKNPKSLKTLFAWCSWNIVITSYSIHYTKLYEDGKKIVTGEPLFGLDFTREGMKLAMIQHPPAFGMKVKDFNEEEIKARNNFV